MKCNRKSFLSVLLMVALVFGSIGYVDAKGGSSFGGGSRGSISSSSSAGRSSSPSTSGFSRSTTSSPSPSASVTKPSTSGGFFSNSSGSKATDSTPKPSSGSWFGFGGSKSDPPKQAAPSTPQQSAPRTYAAPSSQPSGGGNTTIVNKTVIVKRYEAPSDWRPRYYSSPTVVYNHDYFDLWYKMEMLRTVSDIAQRQAIMSEMRRDPHYSQWKAEADKAAAENKELKEQLSTVQSDMQKLKDDVADAGVTLTATPQPKKSSHAWLWILLLLGLAGVGIYYATRRK